MKKIFAQPEMMVVNMKHNDIVCTSPLGYNNAWNGQTEILAPGQRGLDEWNEGF